MAEGLTKYYFDTYDAFSAGIEITKVHPLAILALHEIGIDISMYKSKLIDNFIDHHFDIVLTVCDNAQKECPTFPNASRLIHQNFQDPSATEGTDHIKLNSFRKTRDELLDYLRTIL